MLIRGDRLTDRQRAEVRAAFVYAPQRPALYRVWLRSHAFHFVKDGSRLMASRRFAEPAFLANPRCTFCPHPASGHTRTRCTVKGCRCRATRARKNPLPLSAMPGQLGLQRLGLMV